ncbi:hypothetical protein QBC39DRAFT_363008 [Podospora conica]|nr:hypothetical protein QBC39DRAFT_363008 [Schizothecium conicum]
MVYYSTRLVSYEAPCHYQRLRIPPTADAAAIEKAWTTRDTRAVVSDISPSYTVLSDPSRRLQYDCDVGVKIDIAEKRISDGRELKDAVAAQLGQMEKRVADANEALRKLESRWSYLMVIDSARDRTEDHRIFQDRVDTARASHTELEAECLIKSKALLEYQKSIADELCGMEADLKDLKADERNVMIPLQKERPRQYHQKVRKAWEDAEKRASDQGLCRCTWPVHHPLNATEYYKELILHLSNTMHQKETARKKLDEEVRGKDAKIREKDALLAEKDDQIREKDAQIREKDGQNIEKDAQIQELGAQVCEKDNLIREKDDEIRKISPPTLEEESELLLDCQVCKKKTKFGKKQVRYQILECLECVTSA